MRNELAIKFLSRKENIGIIRNMIGSIVAYRNQTISFANEVKVIISEAITNAIVHAYEGKENETIEVTISYDNEALCLIILDNGIGILDVEQAREPLFSTKKDDERSGLGFTIMEMFSDDFKVESAEGQGTKITMLKNWL